MLPLLPRIHGFARVSRESSLPRFLSAPSIYSRRRRSHPAAVKCRASLSQATPSGLLPVSVSTFFRSLMSVQRTGLLHYPSARPAHAHRSAALAGSRMPYTHPNHPSVLRTGCPAARSPFFQMPAAPLLPALRFSGVFLFNQACPPLIPCAASPFKQNGNRPIGRFPFSLFSIMPAAYASA